MLFCLQEKKNEPKESLEDESALYEETPEEEPYDYSQDWSDYDWWGYDANKRKRNERKKKSIESITHSTPSNQIYEKRQRRRLGSMR